MTRPRFAKLFTVLLAITISSNSLRAAEPIVPEDAKLEKLFEGIVLTEGVAVAPDGPDGLVCDADGNLYVAVRAENRPGIVVYDPDGAELAYIKTEVE